MFTRKIDKCLICSLNKNKLFTEKLKPDIKEGKVFFAIRPNKIDFYYKGQRLFTYDGVFKSHIKFSSIYKTDKEDKNYIAENDLIPGRVKIISNFAEGYERIKENCALYSGDEAVGVSKLYHSFSYASKNCKNQDVVVLDIEVSLKSQDETKKQDRIDLLLFNTKTNTLKFYEAKHYSNKEIWAEKNNRPRVIEQVVDRYEAQIKKKNNEICAAYLEYISTVNKLFDLDILCKKGIRIHPKVCLLIFGYDSDQLKGRFRELVIDRFNKEFGVELYPIGNISSVKDITSLWSLRNKNVSYNSPRYP